MLRLVVPRLVERVLPALPLVSVAGIAAVVVIVVAGSADTTTSVGLVVVLAVVLHNGPGLALGYGIARVSGMDVSARRAISIEVGMQHSGLATVHFSPRGRPAGGRLLGSGTTCPARCWPAGGRGGTLLPGPAATRRWSQDG